MIEVYLHRFFGSEEGTFGILSIPGVSFSCYTAELPWRDNARSVSCIPKGTYRVAVRISPKYGRVYHVKEVPHRSYILIHSGNYVGDVSKGYKTHSQGCILLGKRLGTLGNQRAILNSRVTIRKFMNVLSDVNEFKLIVR